jgi:hypothetical protein
MSRRRQRARGRQRAEQEQFDRAACGRRPSPNAACVVASVYRLINRADVVVIDGRALAYPSLRRLLQSMHRLFIDF